MLFHCLARDICLMPSLCKGNIAIYGSTATCCTLFSYLRGTSLIKRHSRARAVASLNCAFECPEKPHPALTSSTPNHSFTICLPPTSSPTTIFRGSTGSEHSSAQAPTRVPERGRGGGVCGLTEDKMCVHEGGRREGMVGNNYHSWG